MKPKYKISFSGGRTSAYMTKRLLDELSGQYDFIVTFANTGMEHPKTLEFIRNCDRRFGFNTVWLESVVHYDKRKSCTHKIVDFDTASRNGEPYHAYIRKYGIPNAAFPQCTRELKTNPMHSYLKSLGLDHRAIPTAIGIRADETRRVSARAEYNLQYPLIDLWPTTKPEILDWWSDQPFDLEIEEFEGNCLGCFKKSLRKHFLQIQKDPTPYNFYLLMEACYRTVGPQDGERVFFRENRDTLRLFKEYELAKDFIRAMPKDDPEQNGGCSESCEVYPMEEA